MLLNRRAVLASLAVAVPVGAAGCSGDGNEGSTPTATDEPTEPSDQAEEPTVEERIEAGAASVEAAADELEATADELDSIESGGEIDTESVETHLAKAREELDAAAPDATEEQLKTIEALRDVIAILERLTTIIEDIARIQDRLATATDRIDDQRWDAARETLGRADDLTSETRTRASALRDEFEDIDTERLDSVPETDLAQVDSDLEELVATLDALDGLVTVLRQISDGMPSFEAGVAAVEDEQWSEAATAFETASERFTRAEDKLADLAADEDIPADLRADAEELLCEWRPIREATDAFERGARAADEGDTATARSEFEAARETLDETEQC